MKLEFKPLNREEWIMNAVVPINDHVQLSVSYGTRVWYVGEPGNYEAAIQMIDPNSYPGIACLVSFKSTGTNIWSKCNEKKLEALVRLGKKLKYAGAIEVFDIAQGCKEKNWGIRFLCADGYDKESKLEYAKRIWGLEGHKFIPKAYIKEDSLVNELSTGN